MLGQVHVGQHLDPADHRRLQGVDQAPYRHHFVVDAVQDVGALFAGAVIAGVFQRHRDQGLVHGQRHRAQATATRVPVDKQKWVPD